MPFFAYVVRANESGMVVYCGITTKALGRRWSQHKRSPYALGRAIRKYGEAAFSMELIAESWSFDDLKELERLLICQYGTFGPGGYNLTKGGDGILGFRVSDEAREKMSRAHKGRIWTEDEKAALRLAKSGKPHPFSGRHHSDESIAKMKKSFPDRSGEKNNFHGKRHKPETIEKMSGVNNHRYGIRMTDEEREKISGKNNPRFGVRHTEETKRKMSEKQRGANNPNFGKPWSEERRAKHMATLAAKKAKSGAQNAVL